MSDYIVSIDNQESSEQADNLSITGKVNGTQCATVIKLSSLDGLGKNKQKAIKQQALVRAFLNKQITIPESAGEKVSYDD